MYGLFISTTWMNPRAHFAKKYGIQCHKRKHAEGPVHAKIDTVF